MQFAKVIPIPMRKIEQSEKEENVDTQNEIDFEENNKTKYICLSIIGNGKNCYAVKSSSTIAYAINRWKASACAWKSDKLDGKHSEVPNIN